MSNNLITIKDFKMNENGFNNFIIKVNHVSKSGMNRTLSFYKIVKNEIIDITVEVASIAKYNITKEGYLKVGGCGMDMGFKVLYDLFRELFPNKAYQKYNFSYKTI